MEETEGVFDLNTGDEACRSPSDQFQVGDEVVYAPEGVYAKVVGYVWASAVGEPSRIVLYELSCGIAAPGEQIERRAGPPPRRTFKL